MADTSNTKFRDELIAHQIGLLRLSGSINNRIAQLLDATEADLIDKIERVTRALVDAAGVDVSKGVALRRLEALESVIRDMRQAAIDDALDLWTNEMRNLAVAEPAFTMAAVHSVMPVILDMVLPAPALLRALVTEQPFMGQVMRDWAMQMAEADVRRIMNEIRVGMVQGESVTDISRRIVGTAQFNGVDGVTEITRREAEAITRTAVNFFSNAARSEFFNDNADIFTEELFVATLDSRTTAICRSLDGERFPVGQGPKPPLHWRCRSLRTAVLTDEVIGNRPFNPATEKMLLEEFAEEEGLGRITSRDDLPRGMKGKFDEFARRRVREMIGRTPAKTTYAEFLRRQSVAFQNEVLGKTKAKLFRDGGLTLDRFVLRDGQELTLRQLALRHRDAFIAAGLDPDAYF